ncbi:unnamed protein product [Arabidopsis halleri]
MDDDDYDEIDEFLERVLVEPKAPSLLGDAETTRPLNINDRPEPLPSQVQDQPPRSQLPLSSRSVLHDIQILISLGYLDRTSQMFLYVKQGTGLLSFNMDTLNFRN